MRLRVVRLPESPNRAPYLLVFDRVSVDEFTADTVKSMNEGVTERTAGLCHGIVMVEGELDIE